MPYRRRFFGEDPWFTSSYQQPGYIGADAPMWGDIAAPALEETPEGMALRSLYYANALLPYLNPYSRAVLTNRIFAWEQALKDFPQTGATKGATLGGVIPGYVSSVPRAVSSQGFYRHAGTTAEALEAAMRALQGEMTDDGEDRVPFETNWLLDVARQAGQVAPKAGESWTYGQVQDYNDFLATLGQNAPDDMWAQLAQDMFVPLRRKVPTTWSNAPYRASSNWFS